jgi:hypothetical protein
MNIEEKKRKGEEGRKEEYGRIQKGGSEGRFRNKDQKEGSEGRFGRQVHKEGRKVPKEGRKEG